MAGSTESPCMFKIPFHHVDTAMCSHGSVVVARQIASAGRQELKDAFPRLSSLNEGHLAKRH